MKRDREEPFEASAEGRVNESEGVPGEHRAGSPSERTAAAQEQSAGVVHEDHGAEGVVDDMNPYGFTMASDPQHHHGHTDGEGATGLSNLLTGMPGSLPPHPLPVPRGYGSVHQHYGSHQIHDGNVPLYFHLAGFPLPDGSFQKEDGLQQGSNVSSDADQEREVNDDNDDDEGGDDDEDEQEDNDDDDDDDDDVDDDDGIGDNGDGGTEDHPLEDDDRLQGGMEHGTSAGGTPNQDKMQVEGGVTKGDAGRASASAEGESSGTRLGQRAGAAGATIPSPWMGGMWFPHVDPAVARHIMRQKKDSERLNLENVLSRTQKSIARNQRLVKEALVAIRGDDGHSEGGGILDRSVALMARNKKMVKRIQKSVVAHASGDLEIETIPAKRFKREVDTEAKKIMRSLQAHFMDDTTKGAARANTSGGDALGL